MTPMLTPRLSREAKVDQVQEYLGLDPLNRLDDAIWLEFTSMVRRAYDASDIDGTRLWKEVEARAKLQARNNFYRAWASANMDWAPEAGRLEEAVHWRIQAIHKTEKGIHNRNKRALATTTCSSASPTESEESSKHVGAETTAVTAPGQGFFDPVKHAAAQTRND